MTITYTFPLYVPILLGIATTALAVLGFCIKRRNERLKKFNIVHFGFWAIAAVGLVFTVAIATDRVVLDDKKLEQNGWIGQRKGFVLETTSSITISNEERIGRRLRTETHEIWTVRSANGTSIEIDVGDLWEANGADIIERLRARGIAVNDYR